MKICVHDYSGHPFQVELSRSLARRGHEVLHLYSGSFLTPQGALVKGEGDPATFTVEPVTLPEKVDKDNLFKRRVQDRAHGCLAADRIAAFRPDVLLCANTPLDGLAVMQARSQGDGARFVFWVQDLIGQAVQRLLGEKFGPIGRFAGSRYIAVENRLLTRSDRIVLISDDFRDYLPAPLRHDAKVTAIPNWAPLAEVPLHPRDNAWGRAHGLDGGLNVLYSGTLGMKHNPELLVRLAKALQDSGSGRMVVVSEGSSMEFLRKRQAEIGLENLVMLPFQPFSSVPEMLASADVLAAVLEPSAGVFSVPSKVLTYLCAGKPLLLAVPVENLSARIVVENNAGLVCPPTDLDAFVAAGMRLIGDPAARAGMGGNARAYAEAAFDIEAISDRFESVLS